MESAKHGVCSSNTQLKEKELAAAKLNIPRGYSLRRWDHTERPIFVAGSVFDGNSLGKWIYDWARYAYGADTRISEEAGEFWLLVIRLCGYTRRLERLLGCGGRKIRIAMEQYEEVLEVLRNGLSLWSRLEEVVSECQAVVCSTHEYAVMGKFESQCAVVFVQTLLGGGEQLECTRRLMDGLRRWQCRCLIYFNGDVKWYVCLYILMDNI